MRHWTDEERRLQAERIRQQQPWKKGGVKTEAGKARSRMNALKHGAYSEEARLMRDYLRKSHAILKAIRLQERVEREELRLEIHAKGAEIRKMRERNE